MNLERGRRRRFVRSPVVDTPGVERRPRAERARNRPRGGRRRTRGRRNLQEGSSGNAASTAAATDRSTEQHPEGDGSGPGAAEHRRRATIRTTGGQRRAKARAAVRRGKPSKSEPWTWQRGETDPRDRTRSKPSRSRETTRTERREPGMRAPKWTRRSMSRRGEETPRKAPAKARAERCGRTLKERPSAREEDHHGPASRERPRRRIEKR